MTDLKEGQPTEQALVELELAAVHCQGTDIQEVINGLKDRLGQRLPAHEITEIYGLIAVAETQREEIFRRYARLTIKLCRIPHPRQELLSDTHCGAETETDSNLFKSLLEAALETPIPDVFQETATDPSIPESFQNPISDQQTAIPDQ